MTFYLMKALRGHLTQKPGIRDRLESRHLTLDHIQSSPDMYNCDPRLTIQVYPDEVIHWKFYLSLIWRFSV